MKILIVSIKLPYPPKDGGSIATLNLAKGLADTGASVSLLAVNTKKHFYPPEEIPSELKKKIDFHTINLDTSIRPIHLLKNLLFSKKPYIAERFLHKQFEKKLLELLSAQDFDIVQFEGPYQCYYIHLIRKYSRAKISLRAHNLEHEIWKRQAGNTSNPLKKLYMRILSKRILELEKLALNSIDLLIPISERDERLLKTYNSELQSITIPTGLDAAAYPSLKQPATADFFFIGALDWGPNQEGLLWFIRKVLPDIGDMLPKVKFHIAGRNAPESLISSFRHPSIIYHGEIDDAIEYMSKHMIMIAPLFSGSGIRIKILEGMALGKGIITTSIGAEGIPVTHGKDIFIADEPESFTRELESALSDAGKIEQIGKNARTLVQEKFDTFALASRLGSVYKEMI